MQSEGEEIEGLEVGNAWALRPLDQPSSNWLVGDHPAIPPSSLRFLRQGGLASERGEAVENLCIKWFQHDPADDPAWGTAKPISQGRTLSLLAGPGAFELCFQCGPRRRRLVLDQPGDFALWGEGLEHRWRALEPSTVLTVRWALAPKDPRGS